jgi:enhancing lycopene biosynthesis protein 2
MAKRVAVVLSGCGVFDGAEIHESVVTLLALDRAGAEIIIAAPHVEQAHVVNHQTGDVASAEKRRVEVEAARIARGKVRDLATLKASDLDAIIFPGGFGAAKNLCTYAFDGPGLKVNPEVARITTEMARAKKPIGTICIAPVMTAKILADAGIKVTVTIGNDESTASHIRGFGATHQSCPVDEVVVDREHRVVSTPAYMLAASIKEAAAGIEKLVAAVLGLCS